MAVIVGITGGIGSGKTTISKYLESLGYKVYYADDAGRKVMQQQVIIDKVVSIFDSNVLNLDGSLDRKVIASIVFSNPDKLKQLNDIVHPAVSLDFELFKDSLDVNEILIKESAILFESGSNVNCDYVILITAPEDIRIQRVIERDGLSFTDVKNRIDNQMDEENKKNMADFIINNLKIEDSFEDILIVLEEIKRISS